MMPFLLAEFANLEQVLPLYVRVIGNHAQRHLTRPDGYPAHQLFLSRSGRGVFIIDGQQTIAMTKGTLLLLPADTPHEYYSDSPHEEWDLGFIGFHGTAAGPMLQQMNDLLLTAIPISNFNQLWEQLESLWHLLHSNGESAYWESSKRIYGMLISLLENQYTDRKLGKSTITSSHSNTALQTAVNLMHDHYNERLLLSNVARAAGYSVQHFHRLFVASFGMTPQQYMLQLRMRIAVQLFEDYPNMAVEKVAERVGMDTSYFIRMFKRTYGTTPKQYLKK
ncbi:AraC-like DNA-binding protein [Paenibacillus cellulosilyticus]|uniref:AraC-like DNA-binding protein n=1 Tax=Paenibacillus cellulosilyticus TaxID=375489 RepID=A0A2V2YBY3_9BACL|nr:AraC family transcriptional regulator [Paenibacillus cellulosilyticus]PWV89348.1 AraC-like DNA-binding protein [Paenibacillus cellulosilyticus]QKS45156.1 AraC family transcriptional regulator [Paenibacillus cellulosilyticus]